MDNQYLSTVYNPVYNNLLKLYLNNHDECIKKYNEIINSLNEFQGIIDDNPNNEKQLEDGFNKYFNLLKKLP
jgi:hypothetical protein